MGNQGSNLPSPLQRYIATYRVHPNNTINESRERVDLEANDLFDRCVADFPELAARPEFRIGLQHNVNVVPALAALRR